MGQLFVKVSNQLHLRYKMRKSMKKFFSIFSFLIIGALSVFAQDYVVVAKSGNVYDDANTKYITVNQDNDNVTVIPGMVFSSSQHLPGWFKVEYSPGLNAFIQEQITTGNFNPVNSGTYNIANYPGHKLTVEGSGNDWKASVDGKNYQGIDFQNILIFKDINNNIAYSIVDFGNGPIAITYDNSVTNFF